MENLPVSKITMNYLQASGLKIEQFAEALGVNHSDVAAWINGHAEPAHTHLVKLLLKCRNWRFDYALAVLSTRNAEVWGVGGDVWTVAHLLHVQNVALANELIDEMALTAEYNEAAWNQPTQVDGFPTSETGLKSE